jgi:hypothetical protein
MYRTDDLTRCLLALLAKHRLKVRPFGLVQAFAAVVCIDAEPVHHPVTLDLLLADDRNIIF